MAKTSFTLFIFACLMMSTIALAISDEKVGNRVLKSTGAHESSTGAPGERTCAQSGCHEMSEIINDDTTNTLIFSDGDAFYGNQMEGIRLRVRKKDKVKFGFQIVCLDSNNRNIGSWVLLNKERVQTQGADFSVVGAFGRSYVTHTYKGNLAQVPGEIFWDFSWLPPLNGYQGPVTFYVMSNCANNDNTNAGDQFYASKHSLNHISTMTNIDDDSFIPRYIGGGTWSLPLILQFEIQQIDCIDLQGRYHIVEWNRSGLGDVEISFRDQYEAKGFYTFIISYSNGQIIKKHIIL
jgi:hypothetical protein